MLSDPRPAVGRLRRVANAPCSGDRGAVRRRSRCPTTCRSVRSASGSDAVQRVRSAARAPSTAVPSASRSATSANVPSATRTAIDAVGFTSVAPGAGLVSDDGRLPWAAPAGTGRRAVRPGAGGGGRPAIRQHDGEDQTDPSHAEPPAGSPLDAPPERTLEPGTRRYRAQPTSTGSGVSSTPNRVADAVADLPGQREQVARGAVAPVGEREHVLARRAPPGRPDPAWPRGKPACLDQPRRGQLHPVGPGGPARAGPARPGRPPRAAPGW